MNQIALLKFDFTMQNENFPAACMAVGIAFLHPVSS